MKQSKLMSWVETCLNTAIGFAIAITAQMLVFPLFGFNPPLSTNLYIGLIFTVVSIVRGFLLRRLFEALHIRRPNSAFINAVIAERFRQIEQEGWSIDHDAISNREAVQMMARCKEEIKNLRAQIKRLKPKADAYDNLAIVLNLLPRQSMSVGEDLVWVLDKRMRELAEASASEVSDDR